VTPTEAALRVLLEPGSTAELRVPKAGRARVISGYFDDPEAMAQVAARLDGRHPGIYFTCNPVKPALLARASNRVVEHAELTTGDHDVARRRWLPIDLDPVRPAGVSATDTEHAAAIAKAREIAAFLAEQGWPGPVLTDSGNGAYVLVRVDLPNDEAGRELLHRCLETLALRFDDEAVHVDLTMFNAARIIRVPGTRNAKGDSTGDRPHRTARLLEVPDPLEVASAEQLRALAAILPEPEPAGTTGARRGEQAAAFDLEAFIAKHLQVHHENPWGQGGHRWVLTACPFNSDHAELSAYVARRPSGAIVAGCQHNSCTWSWRDLRDKLDPKPDRPARGKGKAKGKREAAAPPVPVAEAPPAEAVPLEHGAELLDEAEAFLRRFVVFASDAQVVAAALWVVHTWCFEAAETTAYLHVTSPEKRSGKSRLVEVLAQLARGALQAADMTAAALYRSITDPAPAVLFDEVQELFGRSADDDQRQLRACLNSGYRLGGAARRCVGDGANQTVAEFPTFCPKVLAGTGSLPDMLADRSIPLQLQRKTRDERVERFRIRRIRGEAEALRRRLAGWAQVAMPVLQDAEPDLPEQLDDRAQDCWEALLALGDQAAGDWPKRARAAAVELAGGDRLADPSIGTLLLAHCWEAFAGEDADRLATAKLLELLCAREDGPWAEEWAKYLRDGHDKIAAARLAKLLRPFGIAPKVLDFDGRKARGYALSAFGDAFGRYLPTGDLRAAPLPRNAPAQSAFPDVTKNPPVTSPQAVDQQSYTVTSPSAGTGPEPGDGSLGGRGEWP